MQLAPLLLILLIVVIFILVRRNQTSKVQVEQQDDRITFDYNRVRPPTTDDSATAATDKNPNEKFCYECGAIIRARTEICPKCGVRQPLPGPHSVSRSGRSKLAAGLLALLLGLFGIHKFYLGRPGMGIVYLLFCWTLIPGIIAFIEGLVYLSMSDDAFEQKYGTD
ncbi:MAG TPA: TM2 domain-containing protein [Stellaceae bacterium]|nr:TM2 domain-containing protein [Stellaceae bacterium]